MSQDGSRRVWWGAADCWEWGSGWLWGHTGLLQEDGELEVQIQGQWIQTTDCWAGIDSEWGDLDRVSVRALDGGWVSGRNLERELGQRWRFGSKF